MNVQRFSSRHSQARARREGFTLIELVLASGLLAVLMIGVFALIDGSLSLWRRTETRRNLTEQASGVVELLSQDLRALDGGSRADLLVEWVQYDTDGDGLKEMGWPRLRFVRQASRAELARMFPSVPAPAPAPAKKGAPKAPQQPPAVAPISGPALIEVCWAVVPMDLKDPDARSEGLLYRGARKLGDGGESYFDKRFIRGNGMPRVAELDEVTGGLLWLQPLMATQTSIVHDGWKPGIEAAQAATSWDAWGSDRPDETVHAWNQASRLMPNVKDRGLLPRRFRIELEFERALDRQRRPRTAQRVELTDVSFDVTDGERLPKPGGFLKIEGEWMKVVRITGDRVNVKRGMRGTQTMVHDPDLIVHWGLQLVREIPVALYREDWDL